MASLYPDPLDVDEVIALTGLTAAANQRTHKLSGGQTQRVRFAIALVGHPGAAGAGRADRGHGRRRPARFLADDALGYAEARQDRSVRDALSGGGRRQRRLQGDDGPGGSLLMVRRPRSRGDRPPHDSRHPGRGSAATSWHAWMASASRSAAGTRHPAPLRFRPRSVRRWSTISMRGTSRSPALRWRRRSWSRPATGRREPVR